MCGALMVAWNPSDSKRDADWVSSALAHGCKLHRAGENRSTRTYGLRRVHVRVTPGEMGSVGGQHDFVDLVRLNDAIFWKGGMQKRSRHCELCTGIGM